MYQSNVVAVVKAGREDLVLRSYRLAATAFASLELAVQEVMQQLSLIIPEGPPRSAVFNVQVMTWKLPSVGHKEAAQEQRLKDKTTSREKERKALAELETAFKASQDLDVVQVEEEPTNGQAGT